MAAALTVLAMSAAAAPAASRPAFRRPARSVPLRCSASAPRDAVRGPPHAFDLCSYVVQQHAAPVPRASSGLVVASCCPVGSHAARLLTPCGQWQASPRSARLMGAAAAAVVLARTPPGSARPHLVSSMMMTQFGRRASRAVPRLKQHPRSAQLGQPMLAGAAFASNGWVAEKSPFEEQQKAYAELVARSKGEKPGAPPHSPHRQASRTHISALGGPRGMLLRHKKPSIVATRVDGRF